MKSGPEASEEVTSPGFTGSQVSGKRHSKAEGLGHAGFV